MRQINKLFIGLLLCSLYFCIGHAAFAATQPGGISVSPATIQLEVSDNEPQQLTQVMVTNSYSLKVDMTAQFKGIDEIAGVLAPTGDIEPSLGQTLSLSQTDFSIEAKQSLLITLKVKNSQKLSPGGHYATLVLSQKLPANKTYSVKPAISISLFIIKSEGEKLSVKLAVPNVKRSFFQLPKTVELVFTNDGNTHIVPRASVQVQSADGKTTYRQAVANVASHIVLPGKIYKETVPLKQAHSLWFPKKLSLITAYRGDGLMAPVLYKKSFWYIPQSWLVAVPIILVLLTVLGFTYGKKRRQRNAKKRHL